MKQEIKILGNRMKRAYNQNNHNRILKDFHLLLCGSKNIENISELLLHSKEKHNILYKAFYHKHNAFCNMIQNKVDNTHKNVILGVI